VPTKYDILLSMSDDEDEEYYDEGDDDNEGDKQDDGNNEVEDNDDDNEDEEYGDEEDRSDDNEGHDNGSAEEAIAEDYGGSSGEEEMDEGQTNRRGTTASFSQRKFREHLERMNREERRAEEPRLRAVDSTACQTASKLTTPSSSGMQHLDKVIVHVMTRKESLRNRQTHVATRVRAFVKNQLFRKVKFVNNDLMIRKAMKVVMDHEDVAEAKRVNFHVLYESAFNEALNTKRSACEQAGGKIVIEAMATMNPDEEFFTIEELCKLRKSTTEREMKAFYWFFASFLECVCGKKAWGKAKFTSLVSLASESNNTRPAKLVTASDEAFALLLFENYIDKWIEMAKTQTPNKEPQPEEAGDNQNKRKAAAANRRRGKYTGAAVKSGHCKFGGWNREGMARFNELYAMVREDRTCPQANEMERNLLEFCNSTRQNADGEATVAAGQGAEAARMLANLEPPVEAVWEDMEDV
jgi:hypothetical protein